MDVDIPRSGCHWAVGIKNGSKLNSNVVHSDRNELPPKSESTRANRYPIRHQRLDFGMASAGTTIIRSGHRSEASANLGGPGPLPHDKSVRQPDRGPDLHAPDASKIALHVLPMFPRQRLCGERVYYVRYTDGLLTIVRGDFEKNVQATMQGKNPAA